MKIHYEDEYDQIIYSCTTDTIPRIGESIQFCGDVLRIINIIWDIETDNVIVQVTQADVKSSVDRGDNNMSAHVNETRNAILQVNKRVDATEKKSRHIAENLSSIKSHLNSTIQQIKKGQT